MSVDSGFVDLRINNVGIAGGNEDSVWPAFTDIMTVVLMIFLISLVAFLIRNSQLVDELQTALIARDQISQRATLSAEENSSLNSQLAQVRERIVSLENSLFKVETARDQFQQTLQDRERAVRDLDKEVALLANLRDQLMDKNSNLLSELDISKFTLTETQENLSDTKNTLNEKISLLLAEKANLVIDQDKSAQALSESETETFELNSKVISLTEQLKLLNEELAAQATQSKSLSTKLEDKGLIMIGLSSGKKKLEEKLEQMALELNKLQALFVSRGAEVSYLQTRINSSDKNYKSLQEEYDSLEEQYRKLIRPARSQAGKYVVDVYFAKQEGKAIYRLKEPDQDAPETVTLGELNTRLLSLKDERGHTLYTKVRIDDTSGVGFTEAWRFTQSILADYDYYSDDLSQINEEPVNE